VHHRHARRGAHRDLEVVLDQQEAHVRRQRREQRDQLAPLGRREPRCGLVEEDQARRAGQRHADLELALLAVREVGDALIGDVRKARAVEQVVGRDARGMARPRAPEAEAPARDAAHGEVEVVAHRQVAEQQRGLVGAP
jgi:hypothetical protein